ncbi:MFS transporter [Frankia sp. CN6]|uniref:MFS transporter n=2 Tax=Frankia nepalensis TaxID=1836974 RepID=A0A937REK7_9ACTN|nr:MFS transporter [Frankia nepalensis]
MFATSFTATALTVAIPPVAAELGGSVGLVAWSVTGSLFVSAVALPITGRLGDLHGHRRVFRTGTTLAVLFAVATACAFDPYSLIAARAGAALASAATIPSSFAMLFKVFPAEERVRPAAWASAVLSGSGVTGLAIGGVVIDSIGWRPMFLIQASIALCALVLALRVLPPMPTEHGANRPGLDKTGALVLTLATFALTFGVNRAAAWGPTLVVVGLLAAVAPLYWLLLWIERRAASPVIPLWLLRKRDILTSSGASFLTNAAHQGNFLVTPLLLQGVFGLSVAMTSVVTISRTLSISLAAPSASRLGARFGPARLATVGIALYVVALAVLVAGTRLDQLWLVIVGLMASGLAYGHSVPPLLVVATNAATPDSFGSTTSLHQTASQIGGVIGLSLMSAIVADAATAGPFAEAYLAAAVLAALGGVAGLACAPRRGAAPEVEGRPMAPEPPAAEARAGQVTAPRDGSGSDRSLEPTR